MKKPLHRDSEQVTKKGVGDIIKKFAMLILTISLILLWGNAIGKAIPRELPPINSVILEKLAPLKQSQESAPDYTKLKNKKYLSKMFVTYNLAAVESSQSRRFDYKNDLTLFFDIVMAVPEDTEVEMFYFVGDTIIMDYDYDLETVEIFCNNLAKSGKFCKVDYELGENYIVRVGIMRE